jgi:hypothetical protein
MTVQFVDPDGSAVNLGPTNEESAAAEDFTEFDD